MAALLVMTGHAEHFEPQATEEIEQYECPIHIFSSRVASRSNATAMIKFWPTLAPHVATLEEKLRVAADCDVETLVGSGDDDESEPQAMDEGSDMQISRSDKNDRTFPEPTNSQTSSGLSEPPSSDSGET